MARSPELCLLGLSALCLLPALLGCEDRCPGGSGDVGDDCEPVLSCGPGEVADGGECVGRGSPDAGPDGGAGTGGTGGAGGIGGSGASTGGGGDAGDALVDASDGDTGGPCEADTTSCSSYSSGVFAIKTVIDVWWQDDVEPPIIDAGRGYITLFQKAAIADACDDDELQDVELTICGLKLPPYTAWATCAAYQLGIAENVWDEPTMPLWNTTGTFSNFEIDGVMALSGINALVGIDLTAAAGAWPPNISDVTCAAGDAEDCFLDHDDDDEPGVGLSLLNIGTTHRANGCGPGSLPVRFQGLPVDALGALCVPSEPSCERAIKLHAGLRVRPAPSAAFDACGTNMAHLNGSSSVTSLDTRAIGCELSSSTSCSVAGAEFVDSMLPSYRILSAETAPPTSVQASPCDCPSGCAGTACQLSQTPSAGPRTAMVWLGPTSSSIDCEDVRDAAEAAYPGTTF